MSASNNVPSQTKQWLLRKKPYGFPVLEGDEPTFVFSKSEIPKLQEGQVLLKLVYLSNDPAQRSWISPLANPDRLYIPPVQEGEVMRSAGIAQVVKSRDPQIRANTLVSCAPGWAEYSVANGADVTPISVPDGLTAPHFLGALGLPGFTAVYALTQVVKATKDDAIVVSGAAGAVGNITIQLAKHWIGCRKVIGIAGTDEKCAWIEKLGADVCINYKSPSFKAQLTKATEGFVEIYFGMIGFEMMSLLFASV